MKKKPVKAYENMQFLNSPSARGLRIMSEYIEPRTRFARHNICDTIVFFGSARVICGEDADARLAGAKEALDHAQEKTPELEAALVAAERTQVLSRYYEDARELAKNMASWAMGLDHGKRFVICSGGGPGIMEAANRGAKEAGGKSVSLNISLPHEQEGNAYQTPELAFEFRYFFMRKFWFVYPGKALVIFPGGFGTMDEMFELLTLIQTRKTAKQMPVVLYGSDFWNEVINFDALVKWGTISPEDLGLFKMCDDVDTAAEFLQSELLRLYPMP